MESQSRKSNANGEVTTAGQRAALYLRVSTGMAKPKRRAMERIGDYRYEAAILGSKTMAGPTSLW